MENLKSLHQQSGSDVLAKVIKLYLYSAPKLIGELRESIHQGNWFAMHHAAHSLKSSSASVGATRIATLSKNLEMMARKQSKAKPSEILNRIEIEYPRIKKAFAKECGVLSTEKQALVASEGARLLIVDDDDVVRYTMRVALESAGFIVEEAINGVQALVAFEETRPDLVLLDVMMPKMDGFTTCVHLRKKTEGAHTPVLMMTGMDDFDSVNKAYEAGATDFLIKPVNPVILAHRLRYTLRATKTALELRESRTRLLSAQRAARIGYWQLDITDGAFHWSDEIRTLFALPRHQHEGSLDSLLDCIHRDDRHDVSRTINKAVRDGITDASEFQVLQPDGTVLVMQQELDISLGDDGGPKLIGTVQDITERKRAEEQIRHLAYYDTIAGLPNRIRLKERLDEALLQAKRAHTGVALFFIDLDHFKLINDTLGHSKGDVLLGQVAMRLRESIRDNDHLSRPDSCATGIGETNAVARLGGDEFVIVTNGLSDRQQVEEMAERIADTLTRVFLVERHELYVTASIGISTYPVDGDNAETLLKHADAAMYHAKNSGRNCSRFYTEANHEGLQTRLALKSDLHKALEHEQFSLHYQPKIALASGRVVGVEALIRWDHPVQGRVSPADFIPLAEETGLIIPIGEWVLCNACAQLKAWHTAGFSEMSVAVNLSSVQFNQANLRAQITKALEDSGIQPQYLELELTESVIMQNTDSSVKLLAELKSIGVSISVDDFGTGYSSLAYLKRFPVTALKIDRSLIRDVTIDADDDAIVSAIIALAHKLRLKVIAEGVENQTQINYLLDQGCEQIQGFLVGRPMPGEEFETWLNGTESQPFQLAQ